MYFHRENFKSNLSNINCYDELIDKKGFDKIV